MQIGLSAASPILDMSSDTLIGEVLVDFLPNGMKEAFDSINRHISFMVTIEEDKFGGDTVIGPDRSQGWKSAKITDLLLPDDSESSGKRRIFEQSFLAPMKKDLTGTGPFHRSGEGGHDEEFAMSYHPVHQRFLRPVDSSDITRGVEIDITQVFAIAIASFNENMTAPFRYVKDDMNRDLKRLAIIDIALAVVVATLFIAFAFRVSQRHIYNSCEVLYQKSHASCAFRLLFT